MPTTPKSPRSPITATTKPPGGSFEVRASSFELRCVARLPIGLTGAGEESIGSLMDNGAEPEGHGMSDDGVRSGEDRRVVGDSRLRRRRRPRRRRNLPYRMRSLRVRDTPDVRTGP